MDPLTGNQYQLIDLYKEIDFFDRKLLWCRNHEKFETEEARAAAAKKLESKRSSLMRSAKELTDKGTECDPKFLPRSFKPVAVVEEK